MVISFGSVMFLTVQENQNFKIWLRKTPALHHRNKMILPNILMKHDVNALFCKLDFFLDMNQFYK